MRTDDHLRRPARRTHRGGHPSDQRAGRVPAAPRRRAGFGTSLDRFDAYVAEPDQHHRNKEPDHVHRHLTPTAPPSRYERTGSGPALVLVDGAMCYRARRPDAAARRAAAGHLHRLRLRPARPGRELGHRCPTPSPARSRTCGPSSRRPVARRTSTPCPPACALALATAAAGAGITRLALYEPPFMAEVEDGTRIKEYTAAASRAARRRPQRRRRRAVHDVRRHAGAGHRRHARPAGLGPARGDRADARVRRRRSWPAGAVPRSWRASIDVPALVLAGGASPVGSAAGGEGGGGCPADGGAPYARRSDRTT